MFSFGNLIIGIIMVVLGVLVLKYTYAVANFTGRVEWIEDKLGGGTTFGVYKLLAVFMVIIGLLIITGLGGPIVDAVFEPLGDSFRGFSGN